MEKLEAFDLQKSYNGRTVVKQVNIEVERGQVVGLLGPNGAGKTTSFYMIVGLVRADNGKIILQGEDVTTLPLPVRAKKGIGYLPQEASVFREMSVEENIFSSVCGLSTNIFPVDEPRKSFNPATSFGFTFNISSRLSLVPPNMNE